VSAFRRTVTILLTLIVPAPAHAASLSEVGRLAAVYDSILAADFTGADAQLRGACPPAPAEACATLAAVSLWWQININPESLLLDQRFNDAAAHAIKAGEAWIKREPTRAEAWFYLAAAQAPLVQWRVLRGERVAAARAGNRIKTALERALALDPDLADAYFGLGLYHYYADVAPTYAKLLRWLLLLPGGNRQLGLREMTTARQRGQLLAGEADFQLQQVYFWYEQKPREAMALLESLDARYPTNPLFLQRIAEADDAYFHDPRGGAAHWRELLSRALDGRVYSAHISETRARLGLAAMQIELGEIDAAIDQLQIVIDAHPVAPIGARARAESLLRAAHEKRNF
jgi:tetratricopeptide (TPR) repeat protein